jgi:hypothetical protein
MDATRKAMRQILSEVTGQAMERASANLGLPSERIEGYLDAADPTEANEHAAYILNQWVKGIIRLPRDRFWVQGVLGRYAARFADPPIRHGTLLDIEDEVGPMTRLRDIDDLTDDNWEGESELVRSREGFLLFRASSEDAFRYHADTGIPRAGMKIGFTPAGFMEAYFLYEHAPDSDGANPRFPYRQLLWYSWDYDSDYREHNRFGVVYQSVDPRELIREIGGMEDEEMARRVAGAMTGGSPEMDAIAFHKLGERGELIKRMVSPAVRDSHETARAAYKEWLESVGPITDEVVALIEHSQNVRVESEERADDRKGVYTGKVVTHDYLSGSDGTARANRRSFERMFGDDEHVSVWDSGNYDDNVRVAIGSPNTEIWGVLGGLDDYSVIEDTGESESELHFEEWSGWASREFIRKIEDTFVDPLYEISEESYNKVQAAFDAKESGDWYSFAMDIAERIGEYWEPYSDGFSINIERIAEDVSVEEVAEFIGVPELPQLLAQSGEVEESADSRQVMRRILHG